MKKGIVGLMVLACLAVALTGCGREEEGPPTGEIRTAPNAELPEGKEPRGGAMQRDVN